MTVDRVAAGYLAIGFAVVSYIAVRIEPSMGFVTPIDYFDPVKVAAGYSSLPWLVENLLYFTFPVALFVLSRSGVQERVARLGVAAACVWLVLASIDRVGIQLSSMTSSQFDVTAAVAAMLPVRLAVLKATVVSTGLFAWATTRTSDPTGVAMRSWRALGWIVLLTSVAFFFVFLPMPVVFCVWTVGLTLTLGETGLRVRGRRARAYL